MGSIWGSQTERDRFPRDVAPRRGAVATRVNGHFLQLKGGSQIFYPQGELGRRGYVVSSKEQEEQLRKRAKLLHIAMLYVKLLLAIGVGLAFSAYTLRAEWWKMGITFLGLAAIEWTVQQAVFRRLTRDMTISRTRNTTIAHWRARAQTMHPLFLLLSTAILAAMAGFGFYFAIQQRSWPLVLASLIIASSFVIGGIGLQGLWKG